MTENEILKKTVRTFLNAVELNRENADKAVESYDDFCEFVENNEELKENMYGFFYKLLDEYVRFRFYTEPIPVLTDNEDYMARYRAGVLKTAKTFFNFGGFEVSDEQ